ncbi:peptide deformylase [Furfurilactobacillus curtus]|uniref:Peptide deformylase n=1 Tax=Furfurilactobacillus curtus TaxID=1746200 RepID=A0ABQ5JRU6_9LACO
MIQPINKNPLTLSQIAPSATLADQQAVIDLVDTLRAHQNEAVGMAANMISVNRRIIAIYLGPLVLPLINPVITQKTRTYTATEGCLSWPGQRQTTRYQTITVDYLDARFKSHTQTFTDLAAQIIQHEVDHCDGIEI